MTTDALAAYSYKELIEELYQRDIRHTPYDDTITITHFEDEILEKECIRRGFRNPPVSQVEEAKNYVVKGDLDRAAKTIRDMIYNLGGKFVTVKIS